MKKATANKTIQVVREAMRIVSKEVNPPNVVRRKNGEMKKVKKEKGSGLDSVFGLWSGRAAKNGKMKKAANKSRKIKDKNRGVAKDWIDSFCRSDMKTMLIAIYDLCDRTVWFEDWYDFHRDLEKVFKRHGFDLYETIYGKDKRTWMKERRSTYAKWKSDFGIKAKRGRKPIIYVKDRPQKS